jgi:hypothetical protein
MADLTVILPGDDGKQRDPVTEELLAYAAESLREQGVEVIDADMDEARAKAEEADPFRQALAKVEAMNKLREAYKPNPDELPRDRKGHLSRKSRRKLGLSNSGGGTRILKLEGTETFYAVTNGTARRLPKGVVPSDFTVVKTLR